MLWIKTWHRATAGRKKKRQLIGPWSPHLCPVCPTLPPHWVSLGCPAHIMGTRRYFGQVRIDLRVLWPLLLRGLGCCSSEVMEAECPSDSGQRDLPFSPAVQIRPSVALACWKRAAQLVVYEQWAGWEWVVGGRAAAGCLVAILRTWSTGFFLKRRKLKFSSSDHAQWWSPWPSSLQP